MTNEEQLMELVGKISHLETKLTVLEAKLDNILRLVEKAGGAWTILKWAGSAIIAGAAFWQFVLDHIKFK